MCQENKGQINMFMQHTKKTGRSSKPNFPDLRNITKMSTLL